MSKHTIEQGERLSESIIWSLQRRFFEERGVSAWSRHIVPNFPTTNAAIARSYARLIEAWVADIQPEQPVCIVELGAGPGRFAYLCLQQLSIPCRYVMTDVAERNIEFWQNHRHLRPLISMGQLDFARFDAETDETITLRISRKTLADSPIVVIANYVFDGLLQDAFQVRSGCLEEGRTHLTASGPEPDLDDANLISRLTMSLRYAPIERRPYYEEADIDSILEEYPQRMSSGRFGFPVATLRCIRRLLALSGGQMLLLSTDKGYNHLHQLDGRDSTSLTRHGSFSFMVNYDAIGRYVVQQGGTALLSTARTGTLEGGAFLFGPGDHSQTRAAFRDHIEALSPADFFQLYQALISLESPSLSLSLTILRMSNFDPVVFHRLHIKMLAPAAVALPSLKQVLRDSLDRVWKNFYPIGPSQDVPFAIGRTLHRMGHLSSALGRYQSSLDIYGPHAATFYNMGSCFHQLGELSLAVDYLERSLKEDPEYTRASEKLVLVKQEHSSSTVRSLR